MENKFDQQKQRIITAAFNKWSETHFSKTSLDSVAKELKMTKAALYRYFAKKRDLEKAMSAQCLSDMGGALDEFIRQHQGDPPEKLIEHYYTFLFHYFSGRPYYFVFLHFYMMRTASEQQEDFSQLRKKIDRLFYSALASGGHPKNSYLIEISSRYIQLLGFFGVMQLFLGRGHFQTNAHCQYFPKQVSGEQKTVDYCLHGFVLDKEHAPMDMEAIEKASWIEQGEMLKPDRIFSAIEEVIAEQGYAKASVEKIAARIGFNKSSLYFYFKNKNDMLLKTIKREQEHFYQLTNTRLKELKNFREKLYTFIIALTSYTVNNPGMITVLNWARYQNIDVVLPKQELKKIFSKFDFIRQAMEQDDLRRDIEDPNNIFIFIFFLIMHKLKELQTQNKSYSGYFPFTRHIFSLICHGITFQIGQKTNQKQRSPYVKIQ